MEDCIFCKIIKGDVPCHKIWEDNEVLAFLDIQPINKGHVLVIPKEHSALISGVNEKVLGKMMKLAQKINQAVRESDLKPQGVNLYLADGEVAGQEVPHAHLHIIPRFDQDGFRLVFPEGYKKEEMDAVISTKTVYKIQVAAMRAHKSQKKDCEKIILARKFLPKEEYFLVKKC